MEILAPPTIAATGRCGACSAFVQRLELGLHGAPGIGRQLMRQAFGRGVRPVRDRECIVDVDVAEPRQRGDEIGIVLRFAVVEAGILQTENVAGLHRGHGLFGDLADAVLGKRDRPADDARGRGGDRLQRVLGIAPLRAAEMREQDHFAALVGDLRYGRRHRFDAG